MNSTFVPAGTGPKSGGVGRPHAAPPLSHANPALDLIKLLPDTFGGDRERQQTRELILEALAKDIVTSDPETVAKIEGAGHQGSGNQGCDGLNAVQLVVELEGMVHNKYPDTSSQNYKGMTKKLV